MWDCNDNYDNDYDNPMGLHILQGDKEQNVCGMTEETSKIKKEYETLFITVPFSKETIMIGETLTKLLCKDRNVRWYELIDNTDMKKNSKKVWRLIKKLNGDPITYTNVINVKSSCYTITSKRKISQIRNYK